jgi:hypothetical protein
MTITPARQPEGIPAGGQFAAHPKAEPVFGLEPAMSTDAFNDLMTDELASGIDAGLKGKLTDPDPDGHYDITRTFEAEPGEEGGMNIYTDCPALGDESVIYSVWHKDGKALVCFDDRYDVDVTPRLLHPETWEGPDAAAAEIAGHILDMEADVASGGSGGGTPDGFASDADYRKWREG